MNPLLKARIIDRMSHSCETESSTAATSAAQHPQQHQHPRLADTNSHLNNKYDFTEFDVINGRGQGVQRHPGNIKYRALVFFNKGLYAKCPRSDKSKISKGIVAAVRELGGRFLESDEHAGGVYWDIGDKKAWAKTSQALREGQTKIRQGQQEAGSGSCDDAPSALISQASRLGKIPTEGYLGLSVQLLEILYNENENKNVPSQCPPTGVVSPCPSPTDAALSLVELSHVSPCRSPIDC